MDESNPRGALESLRRAIQLDPQNAQAHLYLGIVLGAQQVFDRAESELRQAVTLYQLRVREDESERAQLADARNYLASVLFNMQRYDESIAMARLVIEEITYPAAHTAWGTVGMASIGKGDYAQAVTALQRAIAIQPNYCAGRFHLGNAFFHLNDMGHALESLNRAIDTNQPGCDHIQEAFLVRARVHQSLHQPTEAQADFARCVELSADSPTGRECATLNAAVTPSATPVTPVPPASATPSSKRAHRTPPSHASSVAAPVAVVPARANLLTRVPGGTEPARRL